MKENNTKINLLDSPVFKRAVAQKEEQTQTPEIQTAPERSRNPLAVIMGDRGTTMEIVEEPDEPAEEEIVYATVEYDHRTTYVLTNREMTVQKMVKNFIQIERIYVFENFKILNRYQMLDTDNPFEYYDFLLDGLEYRMRTFSEMKNTLRELSCQGHRHSAITVVLKEYIRDLPVKKVKSLCGFLSSGWDLPPQTTFNTRDDMIAQTIHQVEEMMLKPVDEARARIFYKQLYEMVSSSYKDIVFAYGLAAPFLHVFKEIYAIMPILILEGEKAGGKTMLSKIISCKFYNQIFADRDTFGSVSRFMSSLAGSTFPRSFDEVEISAHEIGPALKNHTTSSVPFQRKNQSQQFVINTLLLSPIILNFNHVPKFLQDRALRDRIIHLTIKMGKQDISVSEWLEMYAKIEDGVIGRYLVECTKDWDKDKILEIMSEIRKEDYSDARSQLIDMILKFGAYLSEKFFGLELNLSELHDSIQNSKRKAVEDLRTVVEELIYYGTVRDQYGSFKRTDWVTVETIDYYKKSENIHGILLNSTHKKLICKRIGMPEPKFDSFLELIKDFYPSAEYGRYKAKIGGEYRTVRAIFIPGLDLYNENVSIYDRSIAHEMEGLPDNFF